MARHNQTHNDIKPQNFLVKFKNSPTDLSQIEIVLTDFGMAGPESKGGTPIFTSPECFEKKKSKSDTFSFGRVILFLLLKKEQFLGWLTVPIRTLHISRHICMMKLVVEMTSMTNRLYLHNARMKFNELRTLRLIKPTQSIIDAFDMIVNANSKAMGDYITELSDFR